MHVTRTKGSPIPAYPTLRQFPRAKRLVGIAALGLTAAVGRAGEARLLGDLAVQPRTAGTPPVSVRPPGEMPAQPGPAGTATNAPAAGTNTVKTCTVVRTPGKPAVEPRKKQP